MQKLVNIIASSIGSLTNPNKLSNSFKSIKRINISAPTINKYLDYLIDSFLIEKAIKYNVKGKKYIDTPCKYYFSDLGIRNASLNFRQNEKTHLMENLIYNELLIRGYNVDVGEVSIVTRNKEKKQERINLEVDFVCNLADKRIYVQSAYSLNSEEKYIEESRSLINIPDN